MALLAQVDSATLTETCGESPGFVCEQVLEATENETLAKLADFATGVPVKVTLILLVAWVVNRVVRRAIRRFVRHLGTDRVADALGRVRSRVPLADTGGVRNTRSVQRAETISAVLRSVATAVIWGLAGLIALAELNINLGPLIAGAGIVGVALGFGAQKLVQDFISGIFMVVEDQFGVGDIIDVGDAVGVVEGVSLRTTKLRDLSGTMWHVPNGEVRRVGNMSQLWSRALLDVEVAYGTDLEHATEVVLATAETMATSAEWSAKFVAAPQVWGVERLGADGIAIRLAAKVLPSEQWDIQRELRKRLKAAFDRAGIEIPFPQRSVWMRTDEG